MTERKGEVSEMKRERVQNREKKEWEGYWRGGGERKTERDGDGRWSEKKEIEHEIERARKDRVMGVMRGGIRR